MFGKNDICRDDFPKENSLEMDKNNCLDIKTERLFLEVSNTEILFLRLDGFSNAKQTGKEKE